MNSYEVWFGYHYVTGENLLESVIKKSKTLIVQK
jgi:hypothetical protein